MMLSNSISKDLVNVFMKDGVYYARVKPSIAGDSLEIALHGVSSEEQALAAIAALDGGLRGQPVNDD